MNTRPIRDGFSATGYEPVAETFFGFRAFKVHNNDACPYATGPVEGGVRGYHEGERGALRGIFKHQFQWSAGVNQALCLRAGPRGIPQAVANVQGKPHALLMPECDCGFWAYTNGEHLLSVNGAAVLGIIEGWGKCVLGPDGFRAEKARIVAVAFPGKEDADQADVMIDAASAHLRDAVNKGVHAVTSAFVAFAQTAHRLAQSATGKSLGGPLPLPTLKLPEKAQRPWELVDEPLRAAVTAAYPHARVFESVEAMHAEFPLSDLRGLLPKADPECDTEDDS